MDVAPGRSGDRNTVSRQPAIRVTEGRYVTQVSGGVVNAGFNPYLFGENDPLNDAGVTPPNGGDGLGGGGGGGGGGQDLKITLTSVSYVSVPINSAHPHYTDDTYADKGKPITVPQLEAGKNDPVTYVMGTKPSISAVITVTNAPAAGIKAKLKVNGFAGLSDGVDITEDFTITNGSHTVSFVSNKELPKVVSNSTYGLKWRLEFNNQSTAITNGDTGTQFFVTYGTPAGQGGDPDVTAKRLNRVTNTAAGKSTESAIATAINKLCHDDPGFFGGRGFPNGDGPYWWLIDEPTRVDCISLAILAMKHCLMVGVKAKVDLARPTGGEPPENTDCGDIEHKKSPRGNVWTLGFGIPANWFEGYFIVSGKGYIPESNKSGIKPTDLNVQGDKLRYQIMYVTLGVGTERTLKQYWYNFNVSQQPVDLTPIKFPVPSK